MTFAWVALTAWLLLAEPLQGRRAYRRLLDALHGGDATAREHAYLNSIGHVWLLLLVMLALTLGLGHWTPAQLGLRWPQSLPPPPLVMLAALLLVLPQLAILLRRLVQRAAEAGHGSVQPRAGGSRLLPMLPRTSRERGLFAALAISAGIGEELVWRGFGLALLQLWLPHAPTVLLVAVLAAGFGWAHLYQGVAGVVITGLTGAVMAGLYVTTGSLLLPMVLHALVDLRVLRIRLPAGAAAGKA